MSIHSDGRAGTVGASHGLMATLKASGHTVKNAPKEFWVEFVRTRIRQSEDQKRKYIIPSALQILYFFLGYQHIGWDSDSRRIYPVPVAPDLRYVTNLIQTRVLTDVAALTAFESEFSVVPDDVSIEDSLDTEAIRDILRAFWDSADMKSTMVLAAFQQALFGGVFHRPRFDPLAGPPRRSRPVAQDASGADIVVNGQPQFIDGPTRFTAPLGLVKDELRSIFEMHVPAGANEPRVGPLQWIAEKRAVPTDDIKRLWGKEVDSETEAVDIPSMISLDLGAFLTQVNSPNSEQTFNEVRGSDAAFVHQMHIPAQFEKGLEEGLKLTVVGEELLDKDKGELENGRLPFEYAVMVPVPLMFWGTAPSWQMIDPQRAYNQANAMVRRATQNHAIPHVKALRGAIDPERITSGGRLWIINGGDIGAVRVEQVGALSPAVMAAQASARNDVDEAFGQHGPTRGQALGASPQPVGTIQRLQRADLAGLKPGADVSSEAMSRVAEAILDLMRQNYGTPRFARLVKNVDDVRLLTFDKTMLPEGIGVILKLQVKEPETENELRTQMAEFIKAMPEFFQQRAASDPLFGDFMLDMFNARPPGTLETLETMHVAKQERELMKFKRGLGAEVAVDRNDPHVLHMRVIEKFKATDEWDILRNAAQADDADEATVAHFRGVETHWDEHQQAQQALVQAAQQQAQTAPVNVPQ